MAKNTNVERLCDRELLEKILSIDRFLRRFHYEAFASGIMPSNQEGGSHV